jgi:RNA polymerase sigma-70 factor (ECF subfamily)
METASGSAAEAAPRDEHWEGRLLADAVGGDDRAWQALVEPYQAELHAHSYRMLASLHDADDALQDALLRAWRGLAGFQGRSTLRAWLYRITTNACLRALERRSRRELPLDYGPAAADPEGPLDEPVAESVWLEPYPDGRLAGGLADPAARYEQRESVELAFVASLQHLPPNQRAVLLLREVLGFSVRETAEALAATEAAVNSALQRARRSLTERLPDPSQQATLRQLGDARLGSMVRAYTDALEAGDVAAMVALLTDDVTWSMPPIPTWYAGRDQVARFLAAVPMRERWRHLATGASGQPAVGCYLWDADRDRYEAAVLDVLTLRGDRIAAVTGFMTPEVFPRFGLPVVLPAE